MVRNGGGGGGLGKGGNLVFFGLVKGDRESRERTLQWLRLRQELYNFNPCITATGIYDEKEVEE